MTNRTKRGVIFLKREGEARTLTVYMAEPERIDHPMAPGWATFVVPHEDRGALERRLREGWMVDRVVVETD